MKRGIRKGLSHMVKRESQGHSALACKSKLILIGTPVVGSTSMKMSSLSASKDRGFPALSSCTTLLTFLPFVSWSTSSY